MDVVVVIEVIVVCVKVVVLFDVDVVCKVIVFVVVVVLADVVVRDVKQPLGWSWIFIILKYKYSLCNKKELLSIGTLPDKID